MHIAHQCGHHQVLEKTQVGQEQVPQTVDSNETGKPGLEQMGGSEEIVMSVTSLLAVQRHKMAAQFQAMASQSVPL